MATVNLGSIKFNWQGAYNGATAYSPDDVVSYNGSSYICKLASTGNLPTNTTYFDQMSSAGTNGTDLTSTLTTQGDLVYRDASGLQRLGAGTAGQVLQTGGAGANPSWTNLSSDYVKITEGSLSSVGTFTLNSSNFDGSTYKIFDIFLQFVPNTTTSDSFHMEYSNNDGSSWYSTGISFCTYHTNSAATTTSNPLVGDSTNHWKISHDGFRTSNECLIKLTIGGLNRAVGKSGIWSAMKANQDGSARAMICQGGGVIDESSSTNNALKFFFTGSMQFASGSYKIFGYK